MGLSYIVLAAAVAVLTPSSTHKKEMTPPSAFPTQSASTPGHTGVHHRVTHHHTSTSRVLVKRETELEERERAVAEKEAEIAKREAQANAVPVIPPVDVASIPASSPAEHTRHGGGVFSFLRHKQASADGGALSPAAQLVAKSAADNEANASFDQSRSRSADPQPTSQPYTSFTQYEQASGHSGAHSSSQQPSDKTQVESKPKTNATQGGNRSADPQTNSRSSDANLMLWRPVIDDKGVNQAAYEADLAACRTYAVQAPGTNAHKEGVKAAKKWGVIGIVGAGAMIVASGGLAVLPMMGGSLVAEGGTAAIAGGVSSHASASYKYRSIVSTCLNGRGYKVIG